MSLKSRDEYSFEKNCFLMTWNRCLITIQGRENLNVRNYYSTKVNYVHPIGMNTKIESGYQLYYQQMSYDFTINDVEADNLFEYGEFRNSVYGGVTFNLKKIGMQALLRVENSHISADSVTRPDYTCFLPSVNLQYKFSVSHNLKFTYKGESTGQGFMT
jgi:hypothetical protein